MYMTVARAAVFTVHLFVLNNTLGENTERLSMSSLLVFTRLTDMLESLWPGVFVFSNQQ